MFFAALTKRRLRRGVFCAIVDLQAAIHRCIAERNTEPKPFVWTADPDRVLAAISRGKQTLEAAYQRMPSRRDDLIQPGHPLRSSFAGRAELFTINIVFSDLKGTPH